MNKAQKIRFIDFIYFSSYISYNEKYGENEKNEF